mgnify:CR=1 FL=1
MVSLHGAGRQYDWIMNYAGFLDLAEQHGYVVVTPLGYTRRGGYGYRGDSENDQRAERDVMNVLSLVTDELNIDDRRIYLWGHSMGGSGTYYLASRHPDIWAGLAAVAGGSLEAAYEILAPMQAVFPDQWLVSYNLACYLCQLNRLDEAQAMLDTARAADGDADASDGEGQAGAQVGGGASAKCSAKGKCSGGCCSWGGLLGAFGRPRGGLATCVLILCVGADDRAVVDGIGGPALLLLPPQSAVRARDVLLLRIGIEHTLVADDVGGHALLLHPRPSAFRPLRALDHR